MNLQEANESAGRVGAEMAEALALKVTEALTGLPVSTPKQRAACTFLLICELEGFFQEQDVPNA
jgi:hypothetical protein